MEQSTICAFQAILNGFNPVGPFRFDEQFAVHRYLKKFEQPDDARVAELAQQSWDRFLTYDASLPDQLHMPDPLWYKARSLIHKWLRDFKLGDVEISSGSSFSPNRGFSSIAQRLKNQPWDYTPGSIDQIVRLCEDCRAIRRALEKRFLMLCKNRGWCHRDANRQLWQRLKGDKHVLRSILRVKIHMVCTPQQGSRFSTVRKNNEKRRPINLECLLNMICQRRVGLGLRDMLKTCLGLELEAVPDLHRVRIATRVATVDLQDASDGISMALVRFLFPSWFVRLLEEARSPMVLGPDGDYHILKKVSSMGNGFTFELMTVIFTALCRSLDPHATVFGDDIIVENRFAEPVIRALTSVGLVVNEAKSFVNSPFRESCGGNFHEDTGYIESYDIEWPESIGNCISVYNKVKRLSRRYASFVPLERLLIRAVPKAWRGPAEMPHLVHGPESIDLPSHFATGGPRAPDVRGGRKLDAAVAYLTENLHYQVSRDDWFRKWEFRSDCVGSLRDHIYLPHAWHKYFMYLYAGRRVDDVIRDSGGWVSYLVYGSAESNSSMKQLARAYQASRVEPLEQELV